jgi:2-C-methyl-D-erythritol 4-phosphate cytidylyltransferase
LVIVAAGRGHRMKSRMPKQFLPLSGKPLLAYSIAAAEKSKEIRCGVVVLSKQDIKRGQKVLKRLARRKHWTVAMGGVMRADSVRAGIRALPEGCDPILIHDAARPFAAPALFDAVARAAGRVGAAVPAMPCRDTVKQEKRAHLVKRTVPRERLWLAQTPQGFRRRVAEKFLRKGWSRLTDDVQAVEKLGLPVQIVRGSTLNFKVTEPEDLMLARMLAGDKSYDI